MVNWKDVPATKRKMVDTKKGRQFEELLNNFKMLVEQELVQTQLTLEKAKYVKEKLESENVMGDVK